MLSLTGNRAQLGEMICLGHGNYCHQDHLSVCLSVLELEIRSRMIPQGQSSKVRHAPAVWPG